jgi:hypothetical protein
LAPFAPKGADFVAMGFDKIVKQTKGVLYQFLSGMLADYKYKIDLMVWCHVTPAKGHG